MVLMLVSFLGPWAFDRINVPAKYGCSAPNIRLEGDFCGVPISGIQAFLWIGSGFISIPIRVLTGNFAFFDIIRELSISLIILLPLVPVFSMLLLTLHPNHPRRQIFSILPWILAIGACLFLSSSFGPKQFLASWGLWFYIGLAATALVLEIVILTVDRKQNQMV